MLSEKQLAGELFSIAQEELYELVPHQLFAPRSAMLFLGDAEMKKQACLLRDHSQLSVKFFAIFMYAIICKTELFDLNYFGKGLAMYKPDRAFKYFGCLTLFSSVSGMIDSSGSKLKRQI